MTCQLFAQYPPEVQVLIGSAIGTVILLLFAAMAIAITTIPRRPR